jgi:hypothetical protein
MKGLELSEAIVRKKEVSFAKFLTFKETPEKIGSK